MRPTMRVGSLFSGIGGFDLGLERAGMACEWQVEIDPFCQQVLAHHWPDTQRFEDVKEVGKRNLQSVELICGGFPCQDLSVAGHRKGLAGERSGLFYEFMRIADELAPHWVLIENVPGLLSSNGGGDMGAVLGTLGELGYGWAYRVLDAQYFGVAQRRRRVFIVGCLGGAASAAQVLFEPESCSGDSAPSRQAGRGAARGFETGPGGGRFTELAPTLDTRCKDGPIRNQLGCGVLHTGAVSGTLRAKAAQWDHDGDESKLVAVGYQGGDLGHAIRANPSRADKPSSSTYIVAGFSAGQGSRAGGIGYREEQAPTLKAASGGNMVPTVVGVSTNQRGEGRLRDVHGCLTSSRSGKQFDGVLANGVRRLTPTECERLQGFPDGWTAIDGAADSPRYRALGNAVAVPVAQWIGEAIIND